MKYYMIGDIHGNYYSYTNALSEATHPSIQIGDFGFGFYPHNDKKILEWQADYPDHKFIRGNHDNLQVCKQSPNFIEDGTIIDNMMCIGGAWSIDYATRIEGVSWWADEQLSYTELERLLDVYAIIKPEIMITHDCPFSIIKPLFSDVLLAPGKVIPTRTSQAFQTMYEIHKPRLWIFGHYHVTRDAEIDGTRFICVKDQKYCTIDTETFNVSKQWRL